MRLLANPSLHDHSVDTAIALVDAATNPLDPEESAKAKRFGLLLSIKVASNRMPRRDLFAQRNLAGAMRHRVRRARMEAAFRGRIERARNFAGNRQLFMPFIGLGRERCGEQRLRVRMKPEDGCSRLHYAVDDKPEMIRHKARSGINYRHPDGSLGSRVGVIKLNNRS